MLLEAHQSTMGVGSWSIASKELVAHLILPRSHPSNETTTKGTPVIFVNFNYRLGPLGFPQGQEADDKKILNLGLQDQLAALEWVQANIGFFGGDKRKVTATGESAGSILTSILYLSPEPFERLARGAVRSFRVSVRHEIRADGHIFHRSCNLGSQTVSSRSRLRGTNCFGKSSLAMCLLVRAWPRPVARSPAFETRPRTRSQPLFFKVSS